MHRLVYWIVNRFANKKTKHPVAVSFELFLATFGESTSLPSIVTSTKSDMDTVKACFNDPVDSKCRGNL